MLSSNRSLIFYCFIVLFISGCSTKVVQHQRIPDDYVNKCIIEKFNVSLINNCSISSSLMSLVHQKMKEKVGLLKKYNASDRKIDLNIQLSVAKIANKTATFFAGAFVGNNELNGFVIIHDHETNNIIGSFYVEVDRNYGGYSTFVNLEEAMAEEFANQIMNQITTTKL